MGPALCFPGDAYHPCAGSTAGRLRFAATPGILLSSGLAGHGWQHSCWALYCSEARWYDHAKDAAAGAPQQE